jgi:hypothetical protein
MNLLDTTLITSMEFSRGQLQNFSNQNLEDLLELEGGGGLLTQENNMSTFNYFGGGNEDYSSSMTSSN